jgi:hypothetical protein
MSSPLRGEVWVLGSAWAVTSYGLEAIDGTCPLPKENLSDRTLVNAVRRLGLGPELSEFVSVFAIAMLLHGHCPVVDPMVVQRIFCEHLTTPPKRKH